MKPQNYCSPSCVIVEMLAAQALLQGSAGIGNLVDFDSDSIIPGNLESLGIE